MISCVTVRNNDLFSMNAFFFTQNPLDFYIKLSPETGKRNKVMTSHCLAA